MNIAPPLLHCQRHRVAFIPRCLEHHPDISVAIAGSGLAVGIAAVAQLISIPPSQTDGLIAARAASAWVADAEWMLGGL
jgi:hypothetical protein